MKVAERRAIQRGSGLGTLLKIGLPILTNMLGGSGRNRKRRKMTTRRMVRNIRRRRKNQKGRGIFNKIGSFFDNLF